MTTRRDSLETYKSKRHLGRTSEPKARAVRKHKKPIFVVQEHHASHLHWDFRFELNGVLKSWAIPKGPPTDPTEKHLAVQTEDHPYEYAKFHGTIPEGEYGAGTVSIWDKGTFHTLKQEPLEESVKNGEIALWLDGKKLKGGYALIRTHYRGDNSWLMIKMKDNKSDNQEDHVFKSEAKSK